MLAKCNDCGHIFDAPPPGQFANDRFHDISIDIGEGIPAWCPTCQRASAEYVPGVYEATDGDLKRIEELPLTRVAEIKHVLEELKSRGPDQASKTLEEFQSRVPEALELPIAKSYLGLLAHQANRAEVYAVLGLLIPILLSIIGIRLAKRANQLAEMSLQLARMDQENRTRKANKEARRERNKAAKKQRKKNHGRR